MKRHRRLSGERLIMEYLGRLSEAGLRLPKGSRIAFVGRTKALIERECGPPALADPAYVREFLATLGKPEDLVSKERARLDEAWIKSTYGERNVTRRAATVVNTSRGYRAILSRRKPAAQAQPLPRPRAQQAAPRTASHERDDELIGPESDFPESGTLQADGRPNWQGPATPHQPDPFPGGFKRPSGLAGLSSARVGPAAARLGPVAARLGPVVAQLARGAGQFARDNVLESAAIALIGIGGLIFPFPLWVVGALVAMGSRLWDVRDKGTALLGPVLIALAANVVVAALRGGHDEMIVVYIDALIANILNLLRLGCLLTAAYLVRRVRRGPRVRVPPWEIPL